MNKVRACSCFPKWAQAGFVGSAAIREPLFGQKFLSLKTKVVSLSSSVSGAGDGEVLGILGHQCNSPVEECSSYIVSPGTKRPIVKSLLVRT